MLKQWWLRVVVLLVLALGVLPTLPAAAQSSCTISTRATVRLRAGHSTSDAIVGTMPRNTQLQVLERYLEPIGRRTRIWYRLVKEEAAPTATSEQVWVGGTVQTSGDCANITSGSTAPSAPSTGGSVGTPTGALPQAGNWTLTYGTNINVTCYGKGSADYATSSTFGQTVFDVVVSSTANGFTLERNSFTQDTNGTWHGAYSVPAAQATGEAYIRVDSSRNMLGDIVVTLAVVPNCIFKLPFWAVPR